MGDVMGSVAIAKKFTAAGHGVTFIINNDKEAVKIITRNGFKYIRAMDKDEKAAWGDAIFDVAIVNQLTNTFPVLSIARKHCKKLVTIDDVGPAAKKMADLSINPLYYISGACCDTKYIPLDPIFQNAHNRKKVIRKDVKHILVTMGGADTYGFTPGIIDALKVCADRAAVIIVIGPAFKHDKALERALAKSRLKFTIRHAISTVDMCKLIEWADLVICGGGNTLFEAACCGTPSIVICCEPFEEETAYRIEKMGFGKVIPFEKRLDRSKVAIFVNAMQDMAIRRKHSCLGKRCVDGRGVDRILADVQNYSREIV
jgi:spore coat polysaccharide biosynthesis predicted glycosyltransferase SpsG